MIKVQKKLLNRIKTLLSTWQETGVPARATLHETADELIKWRKANRLPGLWSRPPLILGATLDDGWGHGIQLILKYAAAMGAETRFIGVLKTWQEINTVCQKTTPDMLGLTVLQFDTEDDLITLRNHLPATVKIIAGGPVFKIDPEFQGRVGINYVAKDAAAFMRLLLETVPT